MTIGMHLPGLQIESPLVTSDARNFRPPSWPPPPDFPVIIDASGKVVSVFSAPSWNLTLWAGKSCVVPFGDGDVRGARMSSANADLLRQIAALWLWGPLAAGTAIGLRVRVHRVRQVALVCDRNHILLSDLFRFPHVIDVLSTQIRPSDAMATLGLLHNLLAHREMLGFAILDDEGLKRLARKLPHHETVQTAYIPPRIWAHHTLRLREFLDDYLAHKQQIAACFAFCLEAYRVNAGGWESLFSGGLSGNCRPFHSERAAGVRAGHKLYHGPFLHTARRFGIDELMQRWVGRTNMQSFSVLLNMVRDVGLAYTLTFSLMRVDEGAQLRAGCYTVEQDSLNQDVHLLSGATTKTQQDPDARWICSPSVSVAIEAMSHAAQLRLIAAKHNPHRRLSALDLAKPLLLSRGEEPWGVTGGNSDTTRLGAQGYINTFSRNLLLFDLEQFRITQADLDLARSMTFGLDPEKFAVGKIWPFAWHQLRRTGVCNMLASGLVSEASLRYQLKHLTVVMTRYYGQNHYRLKGRLTDETSGFFLKEMYAAVARGFAELTGSQYVSPHGEKRKDQILRPVSELEHEKLVKAAKSGAVTYRKTLLGTCMQATCVYGGITNIAECMGTGCTGTKPCDNLIINKGNRAILLKLIDDFDAQLGQAPSSSPIWKSLMANRQAAEGAINVIDQT